MKDRIIKFLTHENISATKFADEIGVQRSSISHILSGRNNPSYEFILKMLSRYKYLNAEWLITGSGNMVKKNEQNPAAEDSSNKIKQMDLFQVRQEKAAAKPSEIKTAEAAERINAVDRRIDKILVFYSDKTFEEFSGNKNI